MNNIFLLGDQRTAWQKAVAGILMFTLNLTGGVAAVFATANVAYAAAPVGSTLIFLDEFEQSGNSMTNGWDDFSGSTDGSRSTIDTEGVGSADDFTVGVDGKGLLLEGDDNIGPNEHAQDPDEGVERAIATQGYDSLYVEYSRAWKGGESDDTLVSSYSLDEGSFVVLETQTLGATQGHASASFTIPNASRHTKLTLRFAVNGTDQNDNVGIDDVRVYGTNPPQFYDGFESGSLSGWTTSETPLVDHDNEWTDDNSTASGHDGGAHSTDGHSVLISGEGSENPDDVVYRTIDTTGYENVQVRYSRKTEDFESGDNFKSYFSDNGGSSWSLLETVSSNAAYSSVSFGSLSGSDNNPNFALRFETNANHGNDRSWIDDVVVWGTAIDTDDDGVSDIPDNCPFDSNPQQQDADGDGDGDACDTEADIESCIDATDNDGDEATDLADSDCAQFKPKLTVVKHVDGGPMSAENFILHVNDDNGFIGSESGTEFVYDSSTDYTITEDAAADYVATFDGCTGTVNAGDTATCTVTNHYDLCLNKEGYQTEVPSGHERSGANCIPVDDTPSCEADTDTMTVVSGTDDTTAPATPAVATFEHAEWTADNNITGATWIWDAYHVADPSAESAVTFTKTFTVTGTPTGGTIVIAADNTYTATLNASAVGSSADLDNFHAGTEDSYDVSSLLVSGENTLAITVTNAAYNTTNPEVNPAGLLYKLTVNKNACEPTPPQPACEPQVNLIANGGFEAPALNATSYQDSWDIIPFTDSALKWLGEFVTPGGLGRLGLELQTNTAVGGASASAGAQFAELDGDHPTRIYQDVTTIPGYDYTLSYHFSPRPNTAASENILEVALGGGVVDTHTAAGGSVTNWAPYTKTFVATATVTRVAFADIGNDDNGSTGGVGSYLDEVSFSCVEKHTPKATVVATKVVCDNESDLPDWSAAPPNGHVITADTAQEYVRASEGKCEIDPNWEFQWAPTSMSNPGDNTGEASGWTTFTGSDVITLGEMTSVWVREVWNDAYVHFTGTADVDTVSAEMYCNGDAYHYDNFDYAKNLTDGGTVYCVAFNALAEDGGGETPEDNPQACTDRIDNDDDGYTDANDSDCNPTLTVIKHVINDNGGTKEADDFTLHVNVDVCDNVEGMQTSVPENMYEEDGSCYYEEREYDFGEEALNTVIEWLTPKVAYAFVELFGPWTFSGDEEGTDVTFDGPATYTVTEDADALYSTTYGEGCSGTIGLGEHKTCVVTNDDIQQGGGGGGSSTFDYWGCTNPSAPNYNALANRDDNSCIIGGGTPPTGGETPQGEVLGAATVTEPEMPLPPSCAANPYITDYMKMGKKNDVEQVKLLQTFLNEYMGTNLPVTGFFGPLTKAAVKKLQKDNHAEIIQPWIDAGFSAASLKEGTGVVYKTTKYFINKKKCAELTETLPNLSNDPGLTD